jgi:hypothetical protein
MSNVRDPENRSRKKCVCGGHGAKKKRKNWSREKWGEGGWWGWHHIGRWSYIDLEAYVEGADE